MLIIKSLLKKKKINKNSSLVFISSIATHTYYFGNGIYGAAKSSLMTYTKYCATCLLNCIEKAMGKTVDGRDSIEIINEFGEKI